MKTYARIEHRKSVFKWENSRKSKSIPLKVWINPINKLSKEFQCYFLRTFPIQRFEWRLRQSSTLEFRQAPSDAHHLLNLNTISLRESDAGLDFNDSSRDSIVHWKLLVTSRQFDSLSCKFAAQNATASQWCFEFHKAHMYALMTVTVSCALKNQMLANSELHTCNIFIKPLSSIALRCFYDGISVNYKANRSLPFRELCTLYTVTVIWASRVWRSERKLWGFLRSD